MKKKLVIVCILILILVICCVLFLVVKNNKKPEHLENMTYYETEEYQAIVWNSKTYVPFCAVGNSERGNWIGIVNNDENDRVYEYKNYSTDEWIISFLNSGVMPESMLMKEINVTDIPKGLQSEYEWNKKEFSDLDRFYSSYITRDYKDIRELDEDYNKEQAGVDNCFVIGAMVHNENLYSDFMENYKNKNDAFIRVAQNTVEGDLILDDIMYDKNKDKIYIVTDSTRDKFSTENDRIIQLREYEAITEYEYKDHLYWVAYNGELNDTTFESENIFVITTIN